MRGKCNVMRYLKEVISKTKEDGLNIMIGGGYECSYMGTR